MESTVYCSCRKDRREVAQKLHHMERRMLRGGGPKHTRTNAIITYIRILDNVLSVLFE